MKKTIAIFVHHPTCSIDSVNGVIAALSPLGQIKLFTRHKVQQSFFDDVDLVVFPGGDGEATVFRSLLKSNIPDENYEDDYDLTEDDLVMLDVEDITQKKY